MHKHTYTEEGEIAIVLDYEVCAMHFAATRMLEGGGLARHCCPGAWAVDRRIDDDGVGEGILGKKWETYETSRNHFLRKLWGAAS